MTRFEVRQVVAWRRPVLWTTCATLWAVFLVATLIPDLELPLRQIAPLGFAAALLRTAALIAEERSAGAARTLRGIWLCADAALLTGLLDITGGPFNPFVVIYGTSIWLAAATVSGGWAIVVGVVAAGGYGWLMVDHLQPGLAEHHRLNDFPTHLFTMLFAGSSIADLIAYYVSQLTAARDRAARSERLASITTLAAGAAHELSTPLSTIAVAANELERTARAADDNLADRLHDDVRLIQDSLARCRTILDGMSGRATGDVPVVGAMSASAIAELACAALPAERRQRLAVEVSHGADRAIEGGADVSRALSSLLKNAFDAGRTEPVSLRVYPHDAVWRFEVRDRGPGMSEEARRRAGEPFFTTKPPGEGLGLGLFLARTVAEQYGGSLRFESGNGTTAILELPAVASS